MKRPQFGLRDLVWLVLVFALGSAWAVDRTRLAQSERDAIQSLSATTKQLQHAKTEELAAVDQMRKAFSALLSVDNELRELKSKIDQQSKDRTD